MANAEKPQPGEIYAVALVDRLENKSLLSVFRDPAGVPWYELPFCFTPYWENPAKYY